MKNCLLFVCLWAILQLAISTNPSLQNKVIEFCQQVLQEFPVLPVEKKPDCSENSKPVDCCDIKICQNAQSGVHTIYPPTAGNVPVEVICDMDTVGGGWTVILSRDNQFSENFTADWNQYKNGFGTPGEEYWLGNDNLHALTDKRSNIVRLEYSGNSTENSGTGNLTDFWGEWNTFSVGSEAEKYKLTVADPNLNNTAYHRILEHHHGKSFSTFDQDNDEKTAENCASTRKGGWWYSNCYRINPTGLHSINDETGIHLRYWSKETSEVLGYADQVQLKMRRSICAR